MLAAEQGSRAPGRAQSRFDKTREEGSGHPEPTIGDGAESPDELGRNLCVRQHPLHSESQQGKHARLEELFADDEDPRSDVRRDDGFCERLRPFLRALSSRT